MNRSKVIPLVIHRFRGQGGYVLAASLTLLSALTLVGVTAYMLSSTEIKIGSNFKNNQMALQVAMAGGEQAREALRVKNYSSSQKDSLSDELVYYAGSDGQLSGGGDDIKAATGTLNGVTYNAYVTNDTSEGTSNKTDGNQKVMITSSATGSDGSFAKVQIEVSPISKSLNSPATIYSKGDVTGNGSSLVIDGNDKCGVKGPLAPIYTKDPAVTSLSGNPSILGNPPSPQHGTMDINIPSLIDQIKNSADYTLTQDKNNAQYGDSNNYKTVYSWPDDPNNPNVNGLKLDNVKGYGILLVEGDLVLGGGFEWFGVIIATGSVTLNGGGGSNKINIAGQIYSGTSTLTDVTVNGSNTIEYDSCNVSNALNSKALRIVSWKQTY